MVEPLAEPLTSGAIGVGLGALTVLGKLLFDWLKARREQQAEEAQRTYREQRELRLSVYDEIAYLRAEVRALRADLEFQRRQHHDELERVRSRYEREIGDLRAELTEWQTRYYALQTTCTQLSSENENLRQDLADLRRQISQKEG